MSRKLEKKVPRGYGNCHDTQRFMSHIKEFGLYWLIRGKNKKLLKTFNQKDYETDLCSRSVPLKLIVLTNPLKTLLK